MTPTEEQALKLFHYEDTNGDGTADDWVDRTTPTDVNSPNPDTANNRICATVPSFSFFAVIRDIAPPVMTPTDRVHVLWPPNSKYHTIRISDCVASVKDNWDADVSLDDVEITSVSSDEPEDAQGGGDGNTKDDIVIVDSQTVQLRAERQGDGNGRVYTINYQVTDASGNTATGSCKVSVPHDQGGNPAVDDGAGAGYTVYP